MPDRYPVWPSSLTFLFEECRRCFYLDHVEDLERPRTPFPGVFNRIDDAMKAFFEGRDVADLLGLDPGTIHVPHDTLVSQPLAFEEAGVELFVRGKADALVAFEDGSYGVIDFKTTQAKKQSLERYHRQLEAYAHALERPTEGMRKRAPVTHLGLICVEPQAMRIDGDSYVFDTQPSWHPVERDPDGFQDQLEEVAHVLGRANAPMPGSGCEFCGYRQRAQETEL